MGLVYTGKDRSLEPSVNYKKEGKETLHVTHRIQGNSTPRCEKQAFRKKKKNKSLWLNDKKEYS